MATLEEMKERLARYYASEAKILKSQAWTDKDKSVQHTNLLAIQKGIDKLEKEIGRLEGTTPPMLRQILIRDT